MVTRGKKTEETEIEQSFEMSETPTLPFWQSPEQIEIGAAEIRVESLKVYKVRKKQATDVAEILLDEWGWDKSNKENIEGLMIWKNNGSELVVDEGKIVFYGQEKGDVENLLAKVDSRFEILERVPKKQIYPRWITTGEDEAEAWEVRASLKIDGKQVWSQEREMAKAVIDKEGNLLNLNLVIPFEITEERMVTTRPSSEVEMSEMKIVAMDGENYEIYANQIEINKVKIVDSQIVYLYLFDDEWLRPYFLFDGVTETQVGKVRVRMIAPAYEN